MEIATRQNEDARNVVGLGLTAVIATNHPLKGEHRVLFRSQRMVFFVCRVVFEKRGDGLSLLGRIRESELSDILAINMILRCARIEQISIPNVDCQEATWHLLAAAARFFSLGKLSKIFKLTPKGGDALSRRMALKQI